MLIAFTHGFFLAFGLIIPLGVQNIFVFNQGAIQPNLWSAMPSVLAATLCDALLILLAVLGVSLIILELLWLKTTLFAIGFLFLLYMGYVTWSTKPRVPGAEKRSLSAKRQVLFAISVSILNPHAVMDTIAVIGTNSLNYTGSEKWIFTGACILVSWLWFNGLAIAGHRIHKLATGGIWLNRINKVSALIIWSVAIYIAYQLIQSLK